MKTAEEFYGQAIGFNSAVKQKITNQLFGICKGMNYPVCSLTVRIAPEMKDRIADHFASVSSVAENQDTKVDLKTMAAEYNPDKYGQEAAKDKEALGRFYLEQAKKLARQVGKDQLTEKYRALAKKYLDETVVEQELPEVFILRPSEEPYRFDIKKGEKTPYRLGVEYGTIVHLEYFSSNNKFEVRYRNHPPVKVWAGEKISKDVADDEGVLIATEDTIVFIKATKK